MKILIVIPHYFREGAYAEFASGLDPLPKIAALNEMLTALYRNFGERRHGALPHGAPMPDDVLPKPKLDIVILVNGNHHLLDQVGFSKDSFRVVETNGDPLFLGFEAQDIFKANRGAYDFYAYMEDDLAIHDREFFEKLSWFNDKFGPRALLFPHRYETSRSGSPGKVVVEFDANGRIQKRFRRAGQQEVLKAEWNGMEQSFILPINPHSGCYFLTNEQLELWLKQPSFGERDGSWTGPLESAATLSVGKIFDIYKPSAPNPWFLELEHYGARYANFCAPDKIKYGESPLLTLTKEIVSSKNIDANIREIAKSANSRSDEAAIESRASKDLYALRASPRLLVQALIPAIFNRATRTLRKRIQKTGKPRQQAREENR